MNYTKGNWSEDDGHIFTNIKDRQYNSIATVHDIYDNSGNAENNKSLIVACTNMYEALLAMKDYCKYHDIKLGSGIVKQIEDAIDKAENRTVL